MLDFLVVGAGPFGSTFARRALDAGRSVLVIDKRDHVAGTCYDKVVNGINVHQYGAHIFHTNDRRTWEFVNRFSEFVPYEHRVIARNCTCVFNMPINMSLLHRLYGVHTPEEGRRVIDLRRVPCSRPENLEQWILAAVGPEIYELCVKGYTEKQWGRPCTELPASIIKRLSIRFTYDDRYFNDQWQAMPADGYAKLYGNMLDGAGLELGADYLARRDDWNALAHRIIYSGPIDAFFDFQYGELGWRSLRWETEHFADRDVQGCAVLNETNADVPHTRSMEWKHFERRHTVPQSIVTCEYPVAWEPGLETLYPVRDPANTFLFDKYRGLADLQTRVHFGGRLGSFVYYDQHQAIAEALHLADKLLA